MTLTPRSTCVLGFMLLAGCSSLGRIDREVDALSALVDQVEMRPALDPPPPVKMPPAEPEPPSPPDRTPPTQTALGAGLPTPPPALQPITFLQAEKKPPHRLVVPSGLPGSDAPPITKFPEDPVLKKRYVAELFPPLQPAPKLPPTAPGPEGRPMSLADLQRLAAIYSPAIKSAEAAVEAAKGAVKQAGAYPNPTVFFEQDTVGTGPGGYEGIGFNQLVKTANKLKLQQAAAMMDLLIAKLALKRAYYDVAYQVRTNYFAVLVALEGVKINQALYQFTNEIYKVQVELVEGGPAAPYEAMQLRPLAIQARFNLVTAQNQYLASWKQLAATLGLRDSLPITELAGRVDMPVPVFDYDQVLNHALANHTDVLTANQSIQKAKFLVELAKVIPVPDVGLNVLVQKDYTAAPNIFVHSLQFSVPVPIWDQNLGGIKQAEGLLAQAAAGQDVARNNLTVTLADAYNRYETARENVAIALQQTRDQIRVYRMLYDRRQANFADVGFGDLVTAQQTLASYIAGYVTALGLQWTAVADVANVLQTDDLFQVGPKREMAPVPDLPRLMPPADPASRAGPGSPDAPRVASDWKGESSIIHADRTAEPVSTWRPVPAGTR
jgi:cobalt-zinc-cadmium efflux system outer membrane protein